MKKYFIIIINILVISLYADENNDTTQTSDNFTLLAYPYAFYKPETGLAFGGSAIANFVILPTNFNKPSQVIINGYYTTIHNFSLSIDDEIYLSTFSLNTGLYYDKFLNRFYGYGNETADISDADFKANKYGLSLTFNKYIKTALLGIILDISNWEITDYMDNPFLLNENINGKNGGQSSGLGFSIGFDSRDYVFLPENGYYHSFNVTFYKKVLGSDFNFIRYIIDLRKYWLLGEKISLAWQYFGQFISGEPAFYYYPALGGSKIMRGYYEGRFRDKLYMATQVETAVPFEIFGIDRFSGVAFAGIGEVSNHIGNFSIPGIKWSLGGGLRYLLDKKNRTVLRGEIGFGHGSLGIYFAAGTAF